MPLLVRVVISSVQGHKRHLGAVIAVRERLDGVEHGRGVGVGSLVPAPVHVPPLLEVLNRAVLLRIHVGKVYRVVGVENNLVLQPVDLHYRYGGVVRTGVLQKVVGHARYGREDVTVVVGELLAQGAPVRPPG